MVLKSNGPLPIFSTDIMNKVVGHVSMDTTIYTHAFLYVLYKHVVLLLSLSSSYWCNTYISGYMLLLLYIFLHAVQHHVPPLGVYLMNDSPSVSRDSVQAEFQTTRPVAGVRCFLRSRHDRKWQICKRLLLVQMLQKCNCSFKWYCSISLHK